jgi:hypothetical protein
MAEGNKLSTAACSKAAGGSCKWRLMRLDPQRSSIHRFLHQSPGGAPE